MKLRHIGPNMTLVDLGKGQQLLFSYSTPVAGRNEDGLFRTDKTWSKTTSKHINQYLRDEGADPLDVRLVPQAAIDLYAEVIGAGVFRCYAPF